jgi:hypothetical protein
VLQYFLTASSPADTPHSVKPNCKAPPTSHSELKHTHSPTCSTSHHVHTQPPPDPLPPSPHSPLPRIRSVSPPGSLASPNPLLFPNSPEPPARIPHLKVSRSYAGPRSHIDSQSNPQLQGRHSTHPSTPSTSQSSSDWGRVSKPLSSETHSSTLHPVNLPPLRCQPGPSSTRPTPRADPVVTQPERLRTLTTTSTALKKSSTETGRARKRPRLSQPTPTTPVEGS